MAGEKAARFVGGHADGRELGVVDLPRVLSLPTSDREVESYLLERTEMIDGIEIGTYAPF